MTIDVTYTVVTPFFCAGVDQKAAPELRLPSFKGVLRYWWRALAWSRCDGELGVLRQREDRLFGSADGGQSRILLRLAAATKRETVEVGKVLTVSASNRQPVGEGARYLGYGLMEAFGSHKKGTQAGQLHRPCLRSPFDFTVQIRARDLDDHDLTALTDALIALGTLGGMGARSRRGYGSLVLQSLCLDGRDRWRAPASIEELGERIAQLRHGPRIGLPEFTAVSRDARHVLVSGSVENPVALLDLLGREFVRFRSWGNKGMVFETRSEALFKFDHDLMKTRGHQRGNHPQRIAFGLPHNYGKRKEEKVDPWGDLDRRASPLFFHLHECASKPVAVLSFLPARFLPKGKSDISVGGSRVAQQREPDLYRPVQDFLDRLLDPLRRKEPFTDVMEVPQ